MFRNYFRTLSLFFILILVILVVGTPLSIQAQGNNASNNTGRWNVPNPLRADTFTEVFVLIANWLAGIVATLAVLVVMIGGVQYMASGGNDKKVEAARKTIQWAVIGLIIVLLSWSLLNELLKILEVAPPPDTDLPKLPIEDVIVNAINWIVSIIATVALIAVVIGGVMWVTAGGDEDRAKSSRKWITAAVAGLIIALGAWAIVRVVTRTLFP